MKRSNNISSPSTGHAKVNLFVLQMEGDAATLTKSIDSLVHAMQKPSGTALRAMTPTPPVVALHSASDDEGGLVDAVATEPSANSEQEPAEPITAKGPRKPRTYKIPDVLDQLRANESPDSFKDYVGGRSIDVDVDRGLTVASWLKQKRATTEFDTRHLHTCFEMMSGWKLPDDPGSLLRNMKKRGYVRPIPGKTGTFELTSTGANRYQELR